MSLWKKTPLQLDKEAEKEEEEKEKKKESQWGEGGAEEGGEKKYDIPKEV